jgi:hypothetical protein
MSDNLLQFLAIRWPILTIVGSHLVLPQLPRERLFHRGITLTSEETSPHDEAPAENLS